MDATLLGQLSPPYTYPNPTDTLSSTFWLFPSFLLKINAFLMWYEIWKGRKIVCKRRVWTRVDGIKKQAPYERLMSMSVFFQRWLSQSHVGGRS